MKTIIHHILFLSVLLLLSCSKDEGVEPTPPDPVVNISVSDMVFPDVAANPSTFTITSDVPWTISFSDTKSAPAWCKVEPMSGEKGTTNVVFTITQGNDSYDDRSTNMKIVAGKTVKIITITQKKKDAIIFSKSKFEVGPEESTIQVDLKTNINYLVEIPQEYASWIIKGTTSKTKGLQDKSEIFTIREGTVDGARKGLIIFKSGELKDTVSVFQAKRNVLILNTKEINISNDAASVEVELRSNTEYEIVIPKEVTWVKRNQTRAMRTDLLAFSIDENETYDNRTARIAVKDKNSSLADTLIIHQGQLDAIFIDSNKIELDYGDESFSVKIRSNIDFRFNVPQEAQEWIKVVQTRGLEESSANFTIEPNTGFNREIAIPCTGSNDTNDTLYVKQEGIKTILMEFYDATGGPDWHNNTNWGSDKPINEWYGVNIYRTVANNELYQIGLYSNNLIGTIPKSLGKFTKLNNILLWDNQLKGDIKDLIDALSECKDLEVLSIGSNKFNGIIPPSIQELKSLKTFNASINQLSGQIPNEICSLSELNGLILDHNNLTGEIPRNIGELSNLRGINLDVNQLTGAIPEGLGNIVSLKECHLNYNNLSGPIPTSILTRDDWTKIRDYIINQNSYTIYPPLEYSVLENHVNKDLNLQPTNSHDLFSKNRYTILFSHSYECPYSIEYTPTVVSLFNKYKEKGLGVISYHYCHLPEGKLANIKNYVSQQKMEEFVNLLHIQEYSDQGGRIDASYFFGGRGTPEVIVVDSLGRLCRGLAEDRNKLPEFIRSVLGEPEPEGRYESTDFSRDGEVITLQQASIGNGINIVILGDGFIDKDMGTGGKYEEKAREAMEHFFGKEPVKTFRNRFNVYCVKAVSLNEGIGEEIKTIFSAKYGDGTSIEGDDMKCFEYALKVPNINNIPNVTIINILNDAKYAGTCYMYWNNASIAYCPTVAYDLEQFSQIVQHEATGHGFGKLADEYSYGGRISQDEIDDYRQMSNADGWWSNIDFTDNPLTIKWSSFLSNPLYAATVGIYQGGATYGYGVYRPSEYSIMHHNIGEFNAPSRLAIYKRIMNLSGEIYSYDAFLEYDQINRITTRTAYSLPKDFVPLASPVIVRRKAENRTFVK